MRTSMVVLALSLISLSCRFPWSAEADPMTAAVRTGDVSSVQALLKAGSDPNAPFGVNSWPPLMHAVHKHQLATAKALLDGGADVNRADPNGMTPLMMAAGYGYDDMVSLLLARGANPRLQARDGTNALDFALTGTNDIDRFTIFRCQDSTVQLLSATGVTPKSSSVAAAKAKCGEQSSRNSRTRS